MLRTLVEAGPQLAGESRALLLQLPPAPPEPGARPGDAAAATRTDIRILSAGAEGAFFLQIRIVSAAPPHRHVASASTLFRIAGGQVWIGSPEDETMQRLEDASDAGEMMLALRVALAK